MAQIKVINNYWDPTKPTGPNNPRYIMHGVKKNTLILIMMKRKIKKWDDKDWDDDIED